MVGIEKSWLHLKSMKSAAPAHHWTYSHDLAGLHADFLWFVSNLMLAQWVAQENGSLIKIDADFHVHSFYSYATHSISSISRFFVETRLVIVVELQLFELKWILFWSPQFVSRAINLRINLGNNLGWWMGEFVGYVSWKLELSINICGHGAITVALVTRWMTKFWVGCGWCLAS